MLYATKLKDAVTTLCHSFLLFTEFTAKKLLNTSVGKTGLFEKSKWLILYLYLQIGFSFKR